MISRGRPWSRTRRRNVTEPLAPGQAPLAEGARDGPQHEAGELRRAAVASAVLHAEHPAVGTRAAGDGDGGYPVLVDRDPVVTLATRQRHSRRP